MKLSNLKQLDQSELKQTNAAFSISAIISSVPVLMNSLASILGFFKAAFSIDGEVKDKLTTFKWDNTKKQETSNPSGFNFF
ncbi:hypothetical protein [Mycoplasmopsis bovirhinis]|uniref:hypothetical protein n=1 Tax=Mycoplasmopsis bovirhinis TaxID=29553 RepID=UPI000E708B02|nr:hypothetical protein [Mycoplasmopsis bovirhinis]